MANENLGDPGWQLKWVYQRNVYQSCERPRHGKPDRDGPVVFGKRMARPTAVRVPISSSPSLQKAKTGTWPRNVSTRTHTQQYIAHKNGPNRRTSRDAHTHAVCGSGGSPALRDDLHTAPGPFLRFHAVSLPGAVKIRPSASIPWAVPVLGLGAPPRRGSARAQCSWLARKSCQERDGLVTTSCGYMG